MSEIREYLAAIGRRGGRANTRRQREARASTLRRFWSDVRAGRRAHPRARVIEGEALRQALRKRAELKK